MSRIFTSNGISRQAVSKPDALTTSLVGRDAIRPTDERDDLDIRSYEWARKLKPTEAPETWLVKQVALATQRLDRSRAIDLALRGLQAARAATCWDDDRRLAAEQLATKLAKAPALTVRLLGRTSQGCDWLIARWEGLQTTMTRTGTWDETRRSLAFDLLGIPAAERADYPRLAEDAPPESLRTLAQAEIDRLRALKTDSLDALDRTERALAESGLTADTTDPAIRLLRRQESAHWRRLQWSLAQLKQGLHPIPDHPAPRPRPEPDPEPESDPEPSHRTLPGTEPDPVALPDYRPISLTSPSDFRSLLRSPKGDSPPRNRHERRALRRLTGADLADRRPVAPPLS